MRKSVPSNNKTYVKSTNSYAKDYEKYYKRLSENQPDTYCN